MNIIKNRKSVGAICPACLHPDYTMRHPVDGETTRPSFKCSRCSHLWSYGVDGGKYDEHAITVTGDIMVGL